MRTEYLPRLSDKLLEKKLRSVGAVLITGCKWCGKTSTASQIANSIVYMQDPNRSATYMAMADTMPSMLLEGQSPRLIDEWQMAPVLWDAIRFEVDKRQAVGQFILTGSAVPKDNATAHTGTGRISRLLMRPMSLFESRESNGTVSLSQLFNGDANIGALSELDIPQIAYVICRGGWPASLKMAEEDALQVAVDYVDAIINQDVSRVDGVEKNPQRVRLLLRSLARNISTMVTNTNLLKDITAHDISITPPTMEVYMNALRRIFVVEDVPAWLPALRSKTAIRTSSKRQFVDPSLAVAILGTSPQGILNDFNTFGFLFESLCCRDLRIYSQSIGGEVFHYHDKTELEADMIISLRDGRWAAVEVKTGSREIEMAAQNLIKLANKVDAEKMNNPSFLMVVTGGEYAYRRKDGVYIVPIGCLKD